MTSSVPVICVDGPSGAGKGTLSQHLANAFSWHLLDSGALYRVLGSGCGQASGRAGAEWAWMMGAMSAWS